jgi:DNA polymerase-4
VERLWGVGTVTAAKLHDRGVATVGEVAGLGEPTLVAILGRAAGAHLHALAHNRDPRPVVVGVRRRSIGSQHALGRRSLRSATALDAELTALVDRVTGRMRSAGRVGRTVVLRLRFEDFTRTTRSHTLPQATAHTGTILGAVRVLLAGVMPVIRRQGLTLIGVAVGGLDDAGAVQLALPFDARSTGDLDDALDAVRDRYGAAAVTRAALLGRHHGPPVPLLPD